MKKSIEIKITENIKYRALKLAINRRLGHNECVGLSENEDLLVGVMNKSVFIMATSNSKLSNPTNKLKADGTPVHIVTKSLSFN